LRRVGLLGGTFNPVHQGHIDLGLHVLEAFALDQVLYIFAARPPHKKNMEIAPVEIRWQMLQAALAPFPALVPSDIEMHRTSDSWTIDTVEELNRQYPYDHRYFISGSEGFLKIRTWKEYKRLLHTLTFIVVLRKESHRQEINDLLQEEAIEPAAFPSANTENQLPCVYLFSYPSDKLFISSTLVRSKKKRAESIDRLVDQAVEKIMEDSKLYEK